MGLGLALTQRMIDIHGGYLTVDSELGKDSCFSFSLSLEMSLSASATTNEQTTTAGRQSLSDLDTLPHKPMSSDAEAPLILVADDDPAARELLTLHLTEAEYRVKRATNGVEAGTGEGTRIASVFDPAGCDEATADIPVMMCSIVEGEELSFALGATDYMAKPINRDVLHQKLTALSLGRKSGDQPVHILVIDDDEDIRNLYELMLTDGHYRVHTAASGIEGLSMAEAVEPDIILLDLMMPDMDGFAVVDALKDKFKVAEYSHYCGHS